jgi:hypothetical protein
MKMYGYSTHQPLLVATLVQTNGPILEIGGGYYSTPLIAAFANGQQRRAITIETSQYFYEYLRPFETDFHAIKRMEGVPFDPVGKFVPEAGRDKRFYIELQRAALKEFPGPFSVVFVDQGPGFLRIPAVNFYAQQAEFIVMHDSDHQRYKGDFLSNFRYRWDYTLHVPHTTVVSNTRDCSIFHHLNPNNVVTKASEQKVESVR